MVSYYYTMYKDRGPNHFCEISAKGITGITDPARWVGDSL